MFKFIDKKIEQTIFSGTYDENNPSLYRSYYHEELKGKNILLITSGDSWTWGDNLGKIHKKKPIVLDDPQIRLSTIYGKILSQNLESDWINVAQCGQSNLWMAANLQEILNNVKNHYDKIYVVVTLTELGRELNSNFMNKFDYDNLIKLSTYNKFLSFFEKLTFERFKSIIENSDKKISFLFGRNFTDTFEENKKILPIVEKTWCDFMNEKIKYYPYENNVRMVNFKISISQFQSFCKNYNKVELFDKFIDHESKNIINRIKFLNSYQNQSPNKSNKPDADAHITWANYFYSKIISNN